MHVFIISIVGFTWKLVSLLQLQQLEIKFCTSLISCPSKFRWLKSTRNWLNSVSALGVTEVSHLWEQQLTWAHTSLTIPTLCKSQIKHSICFPFSDTNTISFTGQPWHTKQGNVISSIGNTGKCPLSSYISTVPAGFAWTLNQTNLLKARSTTVLVKVSVMQRYNAANSVERPEQNMTVLEKWNRKVFWVFF